MCHSARAWITYRLRRLAKYSLANYESLQKLLPLMSSRSSARLPASTKARAELSHATFSRSCVLRKRLAKLRLANIGTLQR